MIARRRMTLEEYERLPAPDGLTVPRTELLRGVVYTMSPQNVSHAKAIMFMTHELVRRLGDRYFVLVQLPLALRPDSMPEPDFAIIQAESAATAATHPDQALAVVEVSDSSLSRDRRLKLSLYAEAGIPEYWIVDVTGRRVEVYRSPTPGGYTSQSVHLPEENIAFLFEPEVLFRVAEFLPRSETGGTDP